MFDGIPHRWEAEPVRPPPKREAWPLYAFVTFAVLTVVVYGVKALLHG
jgi:hypothetical protein